MRRLVGNGGGLSALRILLPTDLVCLLVLVLFWSFIGFYWVFLWCFLALGGFALFHRYHKMFSLFGIGLPRELVISVFWPLLLFFIGLRFLATTLTTNRTVLQANPPPIAPPPLLRPLKCHHGPEPRLRTIKGVPDASKGKSPVHHLHYPRRPRQNDLANLLRPPNHLASLQQPFRPPLTSLRKTN